jgi:tetratricopeptide (TPR) repeat protein
MTASADLPLIGQQVALVGKLAVLSRRDVRAVVERLGGTFAPAVTPRTTVLVVGAHDLENPPPPHVRRVLSEGDLCREAGLPDLDVLRSQYYSARDLRGKYSVLRDDHLRCLAKWGLVRPVVGRYSFADLHVLRQAANELERGAALPAVLRQLSAERGGQLALDFQSWAERPVARVVALPSRSVPQPSLFGGDRTADVASANRMLATRYFLEGAELDDGEGRDLERAATAYRRAVLFDPRLVPAVVNLANIYYERDELVEAEALYEKAIRIDPDCFEAHFNIGNILHDLGRFSDAAAAYREALAINPSYPEAHFYLAVTLEKLGRSADARPHWREYRTLAPNGEFAELAREFSD